MGIQENFVTYFLQHLQSNNHIWLFRKKLSHAFCDTDNPTTIYCMTIQVNFVTYFRDSDNPNDHTW